MARWSKADFSQAWALISRAEQLTWQWPLPAGAHRYRPGVLVVPAEWTAWLLMDRAGCPVDLIVIVAGADLQRVRRRILAAKALMMFPPYAARIEGWMKHMPRFIAEHQPAPTPAGREPCVAQGG